VSDPQPGGTDGPQQWSRRRRLALLFVPLLAIVAIVVSMLGVPWQITASALALFVLWLLIDG
jgi:hypothetical protein